MSQRGATGDRRGGFSVVRKRIQWTVSLDKELLREYERSQPSVNGYVRRLEALWNEDHPEMPSTGTALSTRVRRIKRSGVTTQPTPGGNQPDETAEPPTERSDAQIGGGDVEEEGRGPTGAVQSPAAVGNPSTPDIPIPSQSHLRERSPRDDQILWPSCTTRGASLYWKLRAPGSP